LPFRGPIAASGFEHRWYFLFLLVVLALVALYITALGAISVVATLFARETYHTDIDTDDEAELELVREKRFDRERFADRETAGTR